MQNKMSRRTLLTGAGAALAASAAGVFATPKRAAAADTPKDTFRYSLNTSTIRGQKLPIDKEVDIAAEAGYNAIEPWIHELDAFVKAGGSMKDLDKRIRDKGLVVEDTIGFPEWIVEDDAKRAKGLEEARRCMELVSQIGCKRLAAPPVGATDAAHAVTDLMKIADRYRALLDVGEKMGIVPQVEMWGFSKTLGRLGEAAMVAAESGKPQACVLADIYHLHKGGSEFAGLKLLSESCIQVFHVNDYPETPGREKITDAHRVYPGDGVAPLSQVFNDLRKIGFKGVLSLELFNPGYWKQDAMLVAKTGLEKTKAAVQKSLE